jgi:5-methylcytosine-specific restriction endonuclease McrA
MVIDPAKNRKAFDKTDGRCHICGKKLCYSNYGSFGSKGCWEIEHSNPQAVNGTHHLNNLYPACITCNRSKGKSPTRSARSFHGRTRAPYSRAKKESIKNSNAILGGTTFGLLGSVAGPAGLVFGALLGAVIGHSINPEG